MPDFRADKLRNVILLSHTGAGKTSLSEALLYGAGIVNRLGRVTEGNTVSDFDPEEIKRVSSISTSVLPLVWKETKVNIIDVPGYFDFVGEVKSALRVADGAVVLVCAASGVEVGTELFWEFANETDLPRVLFLNKIDRDTADFSRTLAQIEKTFGRKCVPVQCPIGHHETFRGVFDLISMKAPTGVEVDSTSQGQIDALRQKLVEGIAETDDDLATKYLEGEEITQEEIRQALRAGTRQNKIAPILVGSGLHSKGVAELADAICDYLPSPSDRGGTLAQCGDAQETMLPEADAPPTALVFKTSADPYVGKLSYMRVFSGTISSDSAVWNATKKKAERLGQLYTVRGKTQEPVPHITAGDIGAVAKLADTGTGDTLATREHPVTFAPIEFPTPNYAVSVHPRTKADIDKMGAVLGKLSEEDPSISIRKDPDTGETILAGYGDAQIEVIAEKMKRKFSLEADLGLPTIPYKETITVPVKSEYKHKKQTGGHGQYGHVLIQLEPLPRGSGYEFASGVVGGAVPKNYIPAVEKGIAEALQSGSLPNSSIVDLKVTLYDGSYHPVDSSEISFKIAASHALRKGVSEAQPVVLEPIMNVKITVPETYTGEVIGDLNGKRARVLGMMPQHGVNVIEAQAPLAEMLRYTIDLRSMTRGRGSYAIQYSHYDPVPQHIAQKLIADAKKEKP